MNISDKLGSRKRIAGWFGGAAILFLVLIGAITPDTNSSEINLDSTSNPSTLLASNRKEEVKPTTEVLTEAQEVPYEKITVDDASLNKGASRVTTVGVNGERTLTYEITKLDGKVTTKRLVKEEITTQPVSEVTSIGTKVVIITPKTTQSCDPNYSGACVPIASDVDCGRGSGNGPAYVYGTVKVIGVDIYDLDRDGDGYGCE